MRGTHSKLVVTLGWVVLSGCRAVVDSGVTYCDRSHYVEEFAVGTTLENLAQRCWKVANTQKESEIALLDGDLVIRVATPADGRGERWSGDERGPMMFQRFHGDFLVLTRVEALNQVSGTHCLREGNTAGLVVRRPSDAQWATLLIGPAMPDSAGDCESATNVPKTRAKLESGSNAWGDPILVDAGLGVGTDGESDIAACRVNDKLVFYYRDPATRLTAPRWVPLNGAIPYLAAGDIDVGLTASGGPTFEVAGHFSSVAVSDVLGPDGCTAALEGLILPQQ